MRRLNWTAQSRRDLYIINGWLAEHADPHIAIDIVTRIQDRTTFLMAYSFAGAPDDIDTRRLRVANTSYLILYRVPSDDLIDILRIRHDRQDRVKPVRSS
ncbi:MAG TPA: type II toxin-antitoxin system RelE/ParE family toxin [Sphingomonas sp.]|jgi:plasmid stabilization system protein ParE|uniref:type II toxin-antitoxin system RelE/ParE family toxin n=1 Tax=Sphingomonas sp. TaxID=28214 RepID=UPI002ED813B1